MKLTDAEKTRLLAEGVMGWEHFTHVMEEDGGGCRFAFRLNSEDLPIWSAVWDPLHNEAHAAEVRERMRELKWEVVTTYAKRQDIASMSNKAVDVIRGGEHGTMMRLVAECALLALGLAKEEKL